MSLQPFRLEIVDADGRKLLVSGILDSHTADLLTQAIHRLGAEADATLDLASIEFIDSSGLRVLVAGHQDFEAAGTRLTLMGTSDSVRKLLEITGLLDHLHLG